MKKLVALLVIAVVAMPAMAATTMSCAQVGQTKTFTVSYSYDGVGSAPRAFALDITTSAGTIAGVTAAKVGVSVAGSLGYGIFPGTIVIDTAAGTVSNNGSPIAPDADLPAGTLDGVGTSGVTVELGSLYADSTGKPAVSGILVSVTVSTLPATITIVPNTARGGVVLEDATSIGAFSSTCSLIAPPSDCFSSSLTTFARWTLSGKPACWCPPTSVTLLPTGGTGYQCVGDAAQDKYGGTFRVYTTDLGVVTSNWKRTLTTPGYNACADTDHAAYGGTLAVYTADLARVTSNWKKTDAQLNTLLGVGGAGGYCGSATVPPAYK